MLNLHKILTIFQYFNEHKIIKQSTAKSFSMIYHSSAFQHNDNNVNLASNQLTNELCYASYCTPKKPYKRKVKRGFHKSNIANENENANFLLKYIQQFRCAFTKVQLGIKIYLSCNCKIF